MSWAYAGRGHIFGGSPVISKPYAFGYNPQLHTPISSCERSIICIYVRPNPTTQKLKLGRTYHIGHLLSRSRGLETCLRSYKQCLVSHVLRFPPTMMRKGVQYVNSNWVMVRSMNTEMRWPESDLIKKPMYLWHGCRYPSSHLRPNNRKSHCRKLDWRGAM